MNEYVSCFTDPPVKDATRDKAQWFLHGLFRVA